LLLRSRLLLLWLLFVDLQAQDVTYSRQAITQQDESVRSGIDLHVQQHVKPIKSAAG
jgi:hypothetical protein